MDKKLYGLFTLTTYFLLLTTPSYAQRADLGPGPSGILQLQEMMLRVINISVNIGFFTTTAMLVWGGYKFIASGGEAKPLQEAWSVVTWSLLGIVFLAFSWLVLRLVESFTGVPVSSAFCLGFPGGPTNCSYNR
jgi:hypothetical protein